MIIIALIGALLAAIVLWDVFEVVVLPRRVQRAFRPARFLFRGSWRAWRSLVAVAGASRRESLLGIYGPLFLVVLIAAWAAALVIAYAMIYAGLNIGVGSRTGSSSFATDLYFSGTTFFTLGLGDVAPRGDAARAVTVLEAANGFGFLALVIGYFPTFYQAFSRRETAISLLDARAGSPPTAGELIRRHSDGASPQEFVSLLAGWERWCAELLESHLSYPILMSFRSQHERQSWVAALTAILDTSAIILAQGRGNDARAARLTFAMARHAAVDLSDTFSPPPPAMPYDRLPPEDFARLVEIISACAPLAAGPSFARQLDVLRAKYEPFVWTLAHFLSLDLPPWVPASDAIDAWETSLPPSAEASGSTAGAEKVL